ncbi:MAG: divalent metal cation transporter, partial [Prevotella sp.]|nr:divalent metal cation transporter [Prevotella sp.]
KHGLHVEELSQAQSLLTPLLGNNAANIFAIALLLAGISSTITSGMAAGSIFAGMFGESYNARDTHSILGICISLGLSLLIICFISDPFQGLLISQMVLSIQLPFTVFLQVSLTSSKKVMGCYANRKRNSAFLYSLAVIITMLNVWLLIDSLR